MEDNSQQEGRISPTDKRDEEAENNAENKPTVQTDNLDETRSPPSSPLLAQYTDTLSQGIDQDEEDKEKVGASRIPSKDMFDSEFESDSEEDLDNHDVSSNLLDIEENIEDMMETALKEKEKEGSESGSQNSSSSGRSGRGTKRISMSIIPKTKPESSQEPVRRSSRRKAVT